MPLEAGESVLDCLLRHGEGVTHSCRRGVCQACVLKGRGPIPEAAQAGLQDTQRVQGYFVPCRCHPEGELEIEKPGGGRNGAEVVRVEVVGAGVLRVRLRVEKGFEYRPGQYITLFRKDGLGRSYSLASLPEEGELELHVRVVPGGTMGEWLRDEAKAGEGVEVAGPVGNCFYVEGRPEQPLLLAGTGTGLAPLYGIARDALGRGHRGPVWLFHGSLSGEGLYFGEELRALSGRYPGFRYEPVAGNLEPAILEAAPRLEGWRGFVCGNPGFVKSCRKKLFLAGMGLKETYGDAFLPSA